MTFEPGGLPPLEVAPRVDRLRGGLEEAGCDALLVTSMVSIRYLTGFTGSAALLLVGGDEPLFVTDGRYGEQSAAELAAGGVEARIEVAGTDQKEIVAAAVAGVDRLGLEATDVTWARQQRFADHWFPDATLVPTEGLVEALREVKDEGEVARIEAAARIADAALAEVRPRLLDGPSEREVGLELDSAMRRLGAADPSFETIVASGPNGAKPHARPGPRTIEPGDLVVIDFGALVDGYRSDMTRTLAVGEPSIEQQRMLDVVGAAQAAGVEAVGPDVAAAEVDRVCRDVIGEAGWGEAFLHSTGHGVGLEIHEAPRVASTSEATLVPGNVVTVEPGVYLPGRGGVRIEDTLVVTPTGRRPLTNAPKAAAA